MTAIASGTRRGRMIRNFMHMGLGQVATTVLTILMNAAVARALSPSDFGLMYLIMSMGTFAYVVVDWGHGPYIIREASRAPARAGELLGSALAVRAAVALSAGVVVFVIAWVLGYDLRTRLLSSLLMVSWLPQYQALSFGWILRSRERMDREALLNVVLKLMTLLASIACLALGGRVLGLIIAWAVSGSVTLGIALLMYRNLQLPHITASKTTSLELVRGGAAIFAMTMAVAVQPFVNANILYKMASPEVVGWFGAAWVIAGTLIAPATVLDSAMYPRLSAASGNPAEFKRTFAMSFRPLFLLAVLASAGTWLFAEVPVQLIYGLDKFGRASEILRAFAPVQLLLFIDIFFAMAVLASGRSVKLASVKIVSVIIATSLVFFLVPMWQSGFGNGGVGVMYAMAIGELPMFLAGVYLLRRSMDRHTVSDVLRSLAVGGLTVLVFNLLPTYNAVLGIPLCIAVFGGLSLLLGAVKISDLQPLLPARFRT